MAKKKRVQRETGFKQDLKDDLRAAAREALIDGGISYGLQKTVPPEMRRGMRGTFLRSKMRAMLAPITQGFLPTPEPLAGGILDHFFTIPTLSSAVIQHLTHDPRLYRYGEPAKDALDSALTTLLSRNVTRQVGEGNLESPTRAVASAVGGGVGSLAGAITANAIAGAIRKKYDIRTPMSFDPGRLGAIAGSAAGAGFGDYAFSEDQPVARSLYAALGAGLGTASQYGGGRVVNPAMGRAAAGGAAGTMLGHLIHTHLLPKKTKVRKTTPGVKETNVPLEYDDAENTEKTSFDFTDEEGNPTLLGHLRRVGGTALGGALGQLAGIPLGAFHGALSIPADQPLKGAVSPYMRRGSAFGSLIGAALGNYATSGPSGTIGDALAAGLGAGAASAGYYGGDDPGGFMGELHGPTGHMSRATAWDPHAIAALGGAGAAGGVFGDTLSRAIRAAKGSVSRRKERSQQERFSDIPDFDPEDYKHFRSRG